MEMTLGVVRRLQVQSRPLKLGPAGARVYETAPLRTVDRMEISPDGAVGLTADGPVMDAHHVEHPESRNTRGRNGLSLLPAPHYAAMRAQFGARIVDGCAGENLLLDTDDDGWTEETLSGELLLETVDGGPLSLQLVGAAAPCVEFTRWVLERELGPVDDDVRAAMTCLANGIRGFYVTVVGTGTVGAGARLLRRS